MKMLAILFMAALLSAAPAAAGPFEEECGPVDTDGDGWGDGWCDNCTFVYNPSQTDSDGDGCGNACDADFDQNGVVAIGDFSALATRLNTTVPPTAPQYDIAPDPPDGAIAIADFSALATRLNTPPGPSSTTSGTTACP